MVWSLRLLRNKEGFILLPLPKNVSFQEYTKVNFHFFYTKKRDKGERNLDVILVKLITDR